MDDRRDEWRHGVDENLASLNAGQRVWERELNTIHKALAEIDKDLRGSMEDERDGLIARFRVIEASVNMLRSVLDVDKAGNKGIVGRMEELERGDRRSDRHLKVWIAIIGLISALLVAAASNIDRIETFLHKRDHQNTKKVRHHHVLETAIEPETEDESGGALP